MIPSPHCSLMSVLMASALCMIASWVRYTCGSWNKSKFRIGLYKRFDHSKAFLH